MKSQLMGIENAVVNLKNKLKGSKVKKLYEIIDAMLKEKEEMQMVIVKNQESIERTNRIMAEIYEKLESKQNRVK